MSDGSDAARRALSASLVSGIAHDLNGRLGALLGVAHLARTSSPMDEELLGVLDDQIRRLRESVILLRSVPLADSRLEPREVPLSEAIAQAVRLYRCRSGPRLATLHVAPEEGGDAVLQRWGAPLTEALLLVLAAAERGHRETPCRVEITYGANGSGARIRVERCGEPAPGDVELPGGVTEDEILAAAAERLALSGGRLEVEGDVFLLDLEGG